LYRRAGGSCDRCNKTISSTRYGRDVALARSTLGKYAPQRRYLGSKVRFFDRETGPSAGLKGTLVEQFTGMLDQSYENLEGAAAERDGFVVLEQKMLTRRNGPNENVSNAGVRRFPSSSFVDAEGRGSPPLPGIVILAHPFPKGGKPLGRPI
jgi:hypothetical protein